jgi:hypothetical protein
MRRSTIAHVWAMAALASLTGCAKPASEPAGAAMPVRKAGLWDLKMTRDGKAGKLGALRICLDAATDERLGVFGRHFGTGACQRAITQEPGGVYRFESSCKLGNGATVATRGVASGSFDSAYDIRSDVKVSGAPFEPMNGDHEIAISGRFIGACPPGMNAGDINLGSGMKVSLDQLSKLAGAAQAAGGL